MGEVPVALVVSGHGHDRPRAVTCQHIVGNEDRHRVAGGGVGRIGAQEDSGLLPALLTLQVGLGLDRAAVGRDGAGRRGSAIGPPRVDPIRPGGGDQAVDQVVLGRQHQIGGAEQGVWPGGEHLDVHGRAVGRDRREQRLCTGGPADPVALHGLDLLRPVQHVQVVEQPVGVGGDPHHPLPQPFPEHREVAAVAAPVNGHLFVGQHGAQPGAPVDHRISAVDEPVAVDHVGPLPRRQAGPHPPVLEAACAGIEFGDQLGDRAGLVGRRVEPGVVDLQKDPLGPLVELDIGGREAAPAVVAQPEPAQLAPEVHDVGLGPGAGMGSRLHRVLLGGQAERVKSQRVQHIMAGHAEVAGVDVGGDVAQRVADVQPLPRRVREHVLHEQLVFGHRRPVRRGQRTDRIGDVERAQPRPVLLPGAFDAARQRRRVAVRRRIGVRRSGAPRRGGRGFGHANRV